MEALFGDADKDVEIRKNDLLLRSADDMLLCLDGRRLSSTTELSKVLKSLGKGVVDGGLNILNFRLFHNKAEFEKGRAFFVSGSDRQ